MQKKKTNTKQVRPGYATITDQTQAYSTVRMSHRTPTATRQQGYIKVNQSSSVR